MERISPKDFQITVEEGTFMVTDTGTGKKLTLEHFIAHKLTSSPFVVQAVRVRKLQKQYFETRNKFILREGKNAESKLDEMIKTLQNKVPVSK